MGELEVSKGGEKEQTKSKSDFFFESKTQKKRIVIQLNNTFYAPATGDNTVASW
jgi:hypothetical protein